MDQLLLEQERCSAAGLALAAEKRRRRHIEQATAVPTAPSPSVVEAAQIAVPVGTAEKQRGSEQITSEWKGFVVSKAKRHGWSRVATMYMLSQAGDFESREMVAILIQEFGLTRNNASQVIYQSTQEGFTVAVRYGKCRALGKRISWSSDWDFANWPEFLRGLQAEFASQVNAAST